jgi:hypothetical protein
MSIVVDQGLPGVMFLVAAVIWAWRSARAVTKRSQAESRVWGYGAAVAGGLMVAAVAGQFAPYLRTEVQIWLLALLVALRDLAARTPSDAKSVTALPGGGGPEPAPRVARGAFALRAEAERRKWSGAGSD